MYSIKFTPTTQDFKIKSKNDVKYFLEKMITGEAVLMIAKNHCFIIKVKRNEETLIRVSEKIGDLYNPFNPEFVLDENTAISELYKYRKYINLQILGE